MVVPFGVGVGDFIAVGSLISKISVELQKNGEAAPEFQSLLIELEALDRALRQLQDLQPSQHELLQLNSIRATALACARPLQDFLNKISKFEPRLGTFAVKDNRFKGFPRRMQWRLLFKDDVVQLRSILGSHVNTINLLLMTQTVRSITIAENDRAEAVSGLERKIMLHRGLLEDVKGKMTDLKKQHSEANVLLQGQTTVLQSLKTTSDTITAKLEDHDSKLEEVRSSTDAAGQKAASILSTTTDILTLITSGLSTLHSIALQLARTFELCTKFTTEMRTAMAELLQRFWVLQTALNRIERAIPKQISLPTLQFTDAFGDTMALPYQLCQKWSTFRELLRIMYTDRQGWFRIDLGQYLIMNARGDRLIKKKAWQNMVKEGDHLSMCVALDDLLATEGHCPFPSCQALLDNAEIRNGGKVCPECGRWALSTPPPTTKSVHQKLPLLDYEYIEPHDLREDLDNTEDVEIYRQIYVQARAITKENIKSGIDAEQRGRGSVPSENTRTIRIVSPPREKPEEKPIKGILRRPRDKFPEDPAPIREGVAPLKDGKKDIPPDARWTKISRKLVNPAALEAGKERFEARDDFVIVLRVLSREEIQAYADVTQRIRATKGSSDKKPATRANVGDRDERQPRSSRHRHKQERQHRQYPERQYRSTIDDANSIRLALEQKQSRLSVPVRLPDYMRDSRASTTSATRHDSTGYRADEDTDYDGIQYTNPSDLVRDDLERTAEHSNHPLRARRSEVSIRTKIVTETGRDSKI